MGIASQDAIKQLSALVEEVDEPLKVTFKTIHQGYPNETLVRFLKAREWSIPKAHKMLMDCLNWRIQNHIDIILNKPIIPADLYRKIRDSQLVGMSGYTKDGHPVFAIGVGLSTYDKASVNYYVQSHIQINEYRDRVILPAASKKYGRYIGTCVKVLDMTGLKLSALNQLKLLTIISTVDDLNYPEKTDTYYIVNAPYIFSACWKVVKPLLQERTRRKVQVLQGCGRDELLKIVDYASLPHFCKREGSGSSRHSTSGSDDCFSLDHPFHQQLYNYIKQQQGQEYVALLKQGSFHVDVPEPDLEGIKIVKTIESALHKIGDRNGLNHSPSDPKIDGGKKKDRCPGRSTTARRPLAALVWSHSSRHAAARARGAFDEMTDGGPGDDGTKSSPHTGDAFHEMTANGLRRSGHIPPLRAFSERCDLFLQPSSKKRYITDAF